MKNIYKKKKIKEIFSKNEKELFKKQNLILFEKSNLDMDDFIFAFYHYYKTLINLNYINIKLIIETPDYILDNIENEKLVNDHFNCLIDIFNQIELLESSYLTIDLENRKVYAILSIRPISPFNKNIVSNLYYFLNGFPNGVKILEIQKLEKKNIKISKYNNAISY